MYRDASYHTPLLQKSMASINYGKFTCKHCEVVKLNEAQLRNHINRNKHCYAKYQEIAAIVTQDQRPDTDKNEEPAIQTQTGDDNLIFPREELFNVSSTTDFDTGLQLLFKMFDFNNGVGLSENDMDDLLSLILNPKFNAADIPYRSGRAAKKMMDKLLMSRGYLQVLHIFLT